MIGVQLKPGAESKVSWSKLLSIIVPPQVPAISKFYEVPKGYVLWHITLDDDLTDEQTLQVQQEMAAALEGAWEKFDGAQLRQGCEVALKDGDKDKRQQFVNDMCGKIMDAGNVFIWRASQIEQCREIAEAIRARFVGESGNRATIIVSSHRNGLDKLFTNVDRCEIIGKWEDVSKAQHGTLKDLEFPLPVEGMSANEKNTSETAQPSDDFAAALGEGFAALGDKLGGKLDAVVSGVDGVKAEVSGVKTEVAKVGKEVVGVKTEVGEVKKSVNALGERVGAVETAVGTLPAEVSEVLAAEDGIGGQIKKSLDDVGAAVDNLAGDLATAAGIAREERKTATRIALGLGAASLAIGGLAIYDSRQSSAESSESIEMVLAEMRAERAADQAQDIATDIDAPSSADPTP